MFQSRSSLEVRKFGKQIKKPQNITAKKLQKAIINQLIKYIRTFDETWKRN
jgi:hypothetical protein